MHHSDVDMAHEVEINYYQGNHLLASHRHQGFAALLQLNRPMLNEQVILVFQETTYTAEKPASTAGLLVKAYKSVVEDWKEKNSAVPVPHYYRVVDIVNRPEANSTKIKMDVHLTEFGA